VAIAPPATVDEFLARMDLSQYCGIFRDAGFVDLESLKYLRESALGQMPMLEMHRGKIWTEILKITRN
jgi:hypothetical protein